MTASQGARIGVRAESRKPEEGGCRTSRRIIRAVDDGLVEALGSDLALAVRVCLSTSLALSDPLAYASALEVMLGNDKSEPALGVVERRLRELERDLQPSSWASFVGSVVSLRSRYSPEMLRSSQ